MRWLPAFVVLLLFSALVGRPARLVGSSAATRVTGGAQLLTLEAWPDRGAILARQGEGWQRILLADGTRAPVVPVAAAPPALTIRQESDGHELHLDGRLLWRGPSDIVNQAALSPDGRWLVAVRTPRGSETATLSELWRYEIATGEWLRLTANGTAEGYPLISPGGEQVAFLRDGDLWLIPSDRTTTEGSADPLPTAQPAHGAPMGHDPPDTIRVRHVSQGVSNPNTCRPTVPHGQIDVLPFEEYIKRVTPHESPRSWHIETLKAQAVAARSYGWYYTLFPAGSDYDVTDTTSHQYMCDQTYPETNAAVDATAGQHLAYAGNILKSFFSAENSSPTRQYPNWEPISAVDDPLSFGYERYGHGWGFSQWGGKRHADLGWSYLQILRHYYTSTTVEPPAGSSRTLLDLANRPERRYLRGSGARVTFNANNNDITRAREWHNPGSGWTYSEWQDRPYDPDYGWWHLFDIRPLADTPYDNYRVEGATIPENTALDPRPVLRVGIDRTPPGLAVELTQTAGSATFVLSGDDALSGLERRGYSLADWQQEAEAIPGLPVVSDPTASGGAAIELLPGSQSAQTISFAPVPLPQAGHYRVWFRLRTSEVPHHLPVATLRLLDDLGTPMERGIYPLWGSDFAGEGWEWFYVDADSSAEYGGTAAGTLTPQLTWHGLRPLAVDRVFIATRAAMPLNEVTLPVDGPTWVILYASDVAGNAALVRCEVEPQGNRLSIVYDAPPGNHALYLPLVADAEPPVSCVAMG